MTHSNSQAHRQWVLATLEQYESRLLRYAARLLGNDEAARDVVQHVFLRLCDESAERLEGRLAPWLFTVCRNRVLDVVRKDHRWHNTAGAATVANATDSTGVGATTSARSIGGDDPAAVHGREADPAARAEARDLAAWLQRQIDQLPPSQREAVDLWSSGMDYGEIAEVMQRGRGHVRVLVHRGLNELRRLAATTESLTS